MSLTDIQLKEMAKKMHYPLEAVLYKSQLKDHTLKYNVGWIVNLEDEYDDEGRPNDGSHYVAVYVKKCANGNIQPIAFDSYGVAPCKEIVEFIGLGHTPPYNTKDIQSIMNQACGWYCSAFLYFITTFPNRTNSLYDDCEHFTDLFDDLNKSSDWKKNEYVLKHFFRDSRKEIRDKNPIEVFEGCGFKPIKVDSVANPHTITSYPKDSSGLPP